MKKSIDFLNVPSSYIDSLYGRYCENADSVDASWREFFDAFDAGVPDGDVLDAGGRSLGDEFKVYQLIQNYRYYGHLLSDTNPIRPRREHFVPLALEDVGLCKKDLDRRFQIAWEIGLSNATLSEIFDTLKKVYLGSVGFEYSYIRDPRIVSFFKQKAEKDFSHATFSLDQKKRILEKLNEASIFEHFIHTKYIGQKRFSLEGGENLIPMLDALIEKTSSLGSESVVIGMAHRGRLNVLANIVGKTYEEIFHEFEGTVPEGGTMGDGDVKYHKGFSNMLQTKNGEVAIELVPNPSHLEVVNPLVIGYSQAKANSYFKSNFTKILPVLIHGDAAIAGQGIGYEVAQMSKLEGYDVGGIVHIVVNNQLGFTTDYTEARSSLYCTDLAKLTETPVLHVNGDDAEAVVFAAQLAAEFRQFFGQDIFIDMLCYRKYGHNESDEPRFTQPAFYKLIENHPSPREVYKKKLLKKGSIDAQLVDIMEKEFKTHLQERLNYVKQNPLKKLDQYFDKEWEKLRFSQPDDFLHSPDTSVSGEMVVKVAKSLTSIPESFSPIKQIRNLLKERQKMFFESKTLNWASAELLAYGTLLLEGYRVRICGQDSERGTFSHRHAVLRDAETAHTHCSLQHIQDSLGTFQIFNSILSEYGVLGVQYGYAMANPTALVIWDAQFGDFANGAQVMVDQFISSAESKWNKMSSIVLLLPHGYEGQGPEHSSARLERFLQMCAEYNMVVANVTQPSNFFHLLRRQMKWPFRKPLIVMSPKSLLRHPKVISPLGDCLEGGFKEILDDITVDKKNVQRILLCTGKVYYDLLVEREHQNKANVAILRFEQLYPFPLNHFQKLMNNYPKVPIYWVQEEPLNMGSWTYIMQKLSQYSIKVISRKESASPDVGYAKLYKETQKSLVEKALGKDTPPNNNLKES